MDTYDYALASNRKITLIELLIKSSVPRITVCDAGNSDNCCTSCADGLLQMLCKDFLLSDVSNIRVRDDTMIVYVKRGMENE